MRWLVPFLTAALIAAPVLAQEKRSVFAGDDRLNKPVTVHWKKATLNEALAELKKQTGVSVVPDRGVVDEPLMASETNVPARQLLEQIAKLTHFTWSRYGGTPEKPGYLLFKDVAAAREEEEEITRNRRAVLQALQEQIDELKRISRLSPDQLQKELARSNEELDRAFSGGLANVTQSPAVMRRLQSGMSIQTVATPAGRAMVDVLEGLSPAQWQEVMEEDPLVLSTQPRGGETQMPASISDRLRESSPGIPYPKSLFRSLGGNLEDAINKAEEMMKTEWGKASGYKVTVQLSLNMGAQPVGMLRVSPEPIGGTEGVGPLFAVSGLNLIGAPSIFGDPKEDPAEREKRLAADPILGKKAKLKLPPLKPQEGQPALISVLGQSYRATDLLEPMEKAFGIHLLADAYNQKALSMVPPPGEGEISLYKILDQIGGTTRDWERDGDTVRLKSRTWAFDRRSEIPARYMQRWLAERERRGAFNLDDLAEIASLLRDEQVENLMYSALEAGASDFTDFVMISGNRDILRFWSTLLPLQRKTLLAGKTIAARSLYQRQQAALVRVTKPKGGSMFAAFMGGGRTKRTPEQLATAVISVQGGAIPQNAPVPDNPNGGAAVQPPPQVPSGFGTPSGYYLLQINYPDGSKDDFRIALIKPAATSKATARDEVQPDSPTPPAPK